MIGPGQEMAPGEEGGEMQALDVLKAAIHSPVGVAALKVIEHELSSTEAEPSSAPDFAGAKAQALTRMGGGPPA